MSGCWILSNAFSASIDMIMWLFFFSLYMQWIIFIDFFLLSFQFQELFFIFWLFIFHMNCELCLSLFLIYHNSVEVYKINIYIH